MEDFLLPLRRMDVGGECQRLQDLRDLDILDTPDEPAYDAIVEIAAALVDAPMAAIVLVDDERQWLKASVGIGEYPLERAGSFCAHAILNVRAMVVQDATKDFRFADSPSVVGPPRVRFYVGVPLQTYGGNRVGTLCVMDERPRTIDLPVLRLLERLGGLAVDAMEARRPLMPVGDPRPADGREER